MAPLCSWLEMYSARTSKFKRRWFVLERGCLHYYDSPDDVMAHVISGVPPLPQCKRVLEYLSRYGIR